jgi:glutathione gamma-glutamylcysteinyltransferase
LQKNIQFQRLITGNKPSKADTSMATTSTKQRMIPKPGMFYRRILPNTCIPYDGKKGVELFRSALLSGHANCHFALISQFRTQDEPTYCGLGTLAMVLNSLSVDPKRVWKGVWRWFDETLLDCCKPLHEVQNSGINMEEFACLARCNGTMATVTRTLSNTGNGQEEQDKECSCHSGEHMSESLTSFRTAVKAITSQPVDSISSVLVVSYNRGALDQSGGGHFSPLGAYDPDSDSVLILDVARFKYPPHWVKLPLLFKAMKDIDKATGRTRGWITVSSLSSASCVECGAASLFYSIHDQSQAFAWVQRCYEEIEEWLKQNSLRAKEIATKLSVHQTIISFLDGNDEVRFGLGGADARITTETSAANLCKGKKIEAESVRAITHLDASAECTCSSQQNHSALLRRLTGDIERTELFAIVHTALNSLTSNGSNRSKTVAYSVSNCCSDKHDSDGHDISQRLCVGNGISATLPLSDSNTYFNFVAHILTMLMITFNDALVNLSSNICVKKKR